jgi:hypothetical protein
MVRFHLRHGIWVRAKVRIGHVVSFLLIVQSAFSLCFSLPFAEIQASRHSTGILAAFVVSSKHLK